MFYGDPKKKRRSVWLLILDGLMAVLTLCVLLSWLGVWLGRVVPPAVWWVPALVILAGPLIYLGVVVVMGYWLLRWRLFWVLVLALPTLYVLFSMGAFIQMSVWSNKGEELREPLRVVSYNLHSFRNPMAGDSTQMVRVAHWLDSTQADVVLLQEYQPLSVDTTRIAARAFERWGYVAAQNGAHQYETAWGTTVLSHYKILSTRFLSYEGITGGALVVDIDVHGDTVRFYCCHLQTTAFNEVNNEESLGALFDAPDRQVRARGTVRAMRDGFLLREAQADSIAAHVAASPYPVVLGGDMNSVPLSDTYYTLRRGMTDAFRAAGEGYGYTYRPMGSLLRIDYIFSDSQVWDVTEYESQNLPYSDHNPVRAVLRKKIK